MFPLIYTWGNILIKLISLIYQPEKLIFFFLPWGKRTKHNAHKILRENWHTFVKE
jgi:hypothetical protein